MYNRMRIGVDLHELRTKIGRKLLEISPSGIYISAESNAFVPVQKYPL